MAAPDWQSELADIILQLWMEDVTAWVAVDQVRPEMAGPHLSRERHLPSQPLSLRHHEDAAQLYLRSGVTISAATVTIK